MTDIMDLTGRGKSTVYNDMKKIKDIYPQVVGIPSIGYVWREKESEEQKKPMAVITAPAKNDEFKNSEGYNDPTAALALRMMEPKETKVAAGDVWEVQQSTVPGTTREWLIIMVHDTGWCSCLEVFDPHERPAPNNPHIYHFPGDMQNYYVDCRRITTKPVRAFEDYHSKVSGDILDEIRLHTACAMGASVSSPKQGVVKTPRVDIVAEARRQQDVDTLLLKQKAEIYEKCFFALAEGKH